MDDTTIQNKELLMRSNLEGKCDRVQTELVIDAVYQHRKGGSYWLIAIARPIASVADIPKYLRSYSVMHSETEEVFEVYGVGSSAFYIGAPDAPKLAIYQAIGGKPSKAPAGRWGRPLEMFCDGRFTRLEIEVLEQCYYDPRIVPGFYSMHHCPVCGDMVIAGVPHV